jgi:hypothetical protein
MKERIEYPASTKPEGAVYLRFGFSATRRWPQLLGNALERLRNYLPFRELESPPSRSTVSRYTAS